MKRVAVVGGGIAGLATALHTRDRAHAVGLDLETVVLEAQERVGGNIRTDRHDGWTIEWGPNGFLDNVPVTPALVRRLDLEDRYSGPTSAQLNGSCIETADFTCCRPVR